MEPNILEAEILDALHNLEPDDMFVLLHQSRQPAIRGVSLHVGAWLYLVLQTEHQRREGQDEPFTDVIDFNALNDAELAGCLHAAGILINSQPTEKGSDFANAVCRLVIAHATARLQARSIASMN